MDLETWLAVNSGKVRVLAEAMDLLEKSEDIGQARSAIKMLHDCYSIQSYPYCLKKSRDTVEASPAKIRRMANAPWDK